MKNRADINIDRQTGEVIVIDERGKEVYRAPKTERHISIANTIYMYHKYNAAKLVTSPAAQSN